MEAFLENLFLNILNMSITASYVIVVVIIARVFLKKAPKVFSYGLWSVVLFRLICPFSFSSTFSFLQSVGMNAGKMSYIPADIGMVQQPQINTGINRMNSAINASLPVPTDPSVSCNPMQILQFLLLIAWVIGVVVLLTYSIFSFINLKRKISTAMLIQDNIFEAEGISSPFVLGIIPPKIYLPIGIKESERSYILTHEKTHIHRLDHIIKPIAFLTLCLHWFNPLVWVSFILMTKDMEMSCDESVLKQLGTNIKKDYSTSLLSLAIKPNRINAIPLAFGESNVKARIKNILNYRKPNLWILITIAILCVVLLVVCASNPKVNTTDPLAQTTTLAEQLYENKTAYVGDNSKVSALINALPLSKGITRGDIELLTSEEPYGVIIHYEGTDDSQIAVEDDFFKNSVLLLATIDNADTITHIGHWSNLALSSIQFYYSYTRTEIEEILGIDVSQYGQSVDGLTELMDILEHTNLSEKQVSEQMELTPTTPVWSLEQNIGADMAVLDYASDDKVIFHGYFGLYVYDLNTLQIARSLDLKPLKCDATQGDNYCEVFVSKDGNTVQLHPINSENMFVYTVSENKLIESNYKALANPFEGPFIPIEEVFHSDIGIYSYQAVVFNTGDYGMLHTSDWTLGTLSYSRDDMLYALFQNY